MIFFAFRFFFFLWEIKMCTQVGRFLNNEEDDEKLSQANVIVKVSAYSLVFLPYIYSFSASLALIALRIRLGSSSIKLFDICECDWAWFLAEREREREEAEYLNCLLKSMESRSSKDLTIRHVCKRSTWNRNAERRRKIMEEVKDSSNIAT